MTLPHEITAMAHAFTMVTGEPRAVMCPRVRDQSAVGYGVQTVAALADVEARFERVAIALLIGMLRWRYRANG